MRGVKQLVLNTTKPCVYAENMANASPVVGKGYTAPMARAIHWLRQHMPLGR